MNNNYGNLSNEYQRKLITASIRKDVKENEEAHNSRMYPNTNLDKNDFILYLELLFEDLVISRYLFDIRDDQGTSIRNSVQITRYIIMKSDNHIMGTCVSNKIILCYNNDKESNIILKKIIEKLKEEYCILLKLENVVNNNYGEIEKCLLSYIIQFTLVCKYLESGKWIHIGDNMDTIIESKFYDSNCKYFNCIGFKFNILNNEYNILNQIKKQNYKYIIKIHLKISIHIYKVLPLNDVCENMYVYCLPRCSMKATILNIVESNINEKKKINYKTYWLDTHGYILNNNSIEKIIKVKLYKGIFNYPQGVLLRENIYKINTPIHKDQFFYICKFLNKFELLKSSTIKLLTYSEGLKFDPIYNDILQKSAKQNINQDQFYNQIQSLCNNKFSQSQINDDMADKNKRETYYNNAYSMYGNTLTTSTKSININLSTKPKETPINKRNHIYAHEKEKNIDTFLTESTQNYQKIARNNSDNNPESNRRSNANRYEIEDRFCKEIKSLPLQNRDSDLDKYLHQTAKNYKTTHPGNIDKGFDNINTQFIFSKDFQNFIDNIGEVALYKNDQLQTVDFNEREKKRPNFVINSKQNHLENKK
ncbi:conserved Plasmodium protein, unknown function [Plasmodium chabaudi chabaudi]|uniref:Uncharacterized protein n=1 Tax=Plasmodium chabaudi chabaudi TaxID=31271 RepID=A0A4V0KAI7_PLACU|nr:conserved Plasmodium protein, unknown function [Plasmodium chabaudi chabaudi]VTZ70231.1 conserved Plasmodium protein, unknown function [Plasmodium chabaudi chabaudi]|eukprot:XP_016654551.1 conserved Plasmodium protein, unknown function [Plasmodium chabaudi chabaudi]